MTRPPARPLAGILWMIGAGLFTVATNAAIHALGPSVPAVQAAFLRFGLGALVLSPVLLRTLRRGLAPGLARPLVLRSLVHAVAVALWFFALARLTPVESTAIGYLFPVAMMAGGVVLLGERLTATRVWALLVALVGALVILQPGLAPITLAHLAMLGASLVFAASFLMAKVLLRRLEPLVVVAILSIGVSVWLLPFALAVWTPVSARDLALIAGSAATATIGQVMLTRALSLAPVAVLQPVTFFQVLWATAATVLIFGKPVSGAVLAGAVVIVAAVTWAAAREARAGE